jgi:peptidoglycan/xylan/chitin deacetylase (PgdA/CDA1 family)
VIFYLLLSVLTSRQVAFTFDDLPGYGAQSCKISELRELNRDLVAAIRRNNIPALGLVTESNLCGNNPDLLAVWLDAGLDLGNHTASHRDFNVTPLAQFQNDTIAGEKTVKPLLEARGKKLRYFRFPFLRTGTELAKKRAFESFLAKRGYTNAVVTIDNDEYIYAAAYTRALSRGDRKLAARIADDYIRYMEMMFVFYESLSRELLGYELPQILLLHDNRLNADHLDRLVAMTRKRGYKAISIDEALRDPAYKRPDPYLGNRGLSMLMRWAGKPPSAQPDVPRWVMELYRLGERASRPQ